MNCSNFKSKNLLMVDPELYAYIEKSNYGTENQNINTNEKIVNFKNSNKSKRKQDHLDRQITKKIKLSNQACNLANLKNLWDSINQEIAQDLQNNNGDNLSSDKYEERADQYLKIKSKINFKHIMNVNVDEKIKVMECLLEMIHPFPMTEAICKLENKIFKKICKLCDHLNNKQAKKISNLVIFDKRPYFLFNYAAWQSENTFFMITELKKLIELGKKNKDTNTIESGWKEIFQLLMDEINRFKEVKKEFAPLAICDGFNFSNQSLGKCYHTLANCYLDASEDYNNENFLNKAFYSYKEAINYYNECKQYLLRYDNNNLELMAELDDLLESCIESTTK
ncbi:MAG: hypothetical protein H0V82_10755 [Candidatus Protochlamydia sp.]|nr:hypothetical protein [Candidatus Protochlamydia sp.]